MGAEYFSVVFPGSHTSRPVLAGGVYFPFPTPTTLSLASPALVTSSTVAVTISSGMETTSIPSIPLVCFTSLLTKAIA